jgi:uncharacterized membrane protein
VQAGASQPERSRELDRVINFTDAVVAIALTLLVLDIRLPALGAGAYTTDQALLAALGSLWPNYVAFGVSFAVISVWWWTNHRIFRRVVRYDGGLLALDLVWLATIVFLPFPTAVLSANYLPVAIAFYACANAAVGFANVALVVYIDRRGLLEPPDSRTTFRVRLTTLVAYPLVFLASVPVAFLAGVGAAQMTWILVPIIPRIAARIERRAWGAG